MLFRFSVLRALYSETKLNLKENWGCGRGPHPIMAQVWVIGARKQNRIAFHKKYKYDRNPIQF